MYTQSQRSKHCFQNCRAELGVAELNGPQKYFDRSASYLGVEACCVAMVEFGDVYQAYMDSMPAFVPSFQTSPMENPE